MTQVPASLVLWLNLYGEHLISFWGGLIQLSLEQSSISFLHLDDQLDLDLDG